MANIYSLLRLATRIRNPRVRMLGLWFLHLTGRRYTGVFIDPVLGCNLRCKMCYFSDEQKRKEMQGHFSAEELQLVAKALFHRALKLQIGCGAEPTLSKQLIPLIRLGKKYGVPHISLTTNGNLISRSQLQEMLDAGLDELTLSMHGTTRETYEELMVNGRFDRFLTLLSDVAGLAKEYPQFRLRINYTMNADNVAELDAFSGLFQNVPLHVLQLRPIQQIGDSVYSDFSLDRIRSEYDTVIRPLIEECREKGILVIAPEKENLDSLETENAENDAFEKATYIYVSPQQCWRNDFDYRHDSYESYSSRNRLGSEFLRSVFTIGKKNEYSVTRKMNYSVKK